MRKPGRQAGGAGRWGRERKRLHWFYLLLLLRWAHNAAQTLRHHRILPCIMRNVMQSVHCKLRAMQYWMKIQSLAPPPLHTSSPLGANIEDVTVSFHIFTLHCIALLKCSSSSQCRYIQWRLHCTAVQYCTDSIFCSSSSEHKHTELDELLATYDFTIEQSRICIVYYIMCISLQWAADVLKPSSHDSSHFPCALQMCTIVNIYLSLKTSDISAFHLTFSHWVHLK